MTHLKKKFEHIGPGHINPEIDSPKSNQSEECAISSCTSSCSVTTTTVQGNPPPSNSVSSETESGVTISDSDALSSTDGSRSDAAKLRRSKRKKGKDKVAEENNALDPVRYKTKMCKNWQQHEKCPYGPRCLFAHGTKEMRTYTVNHNAITTACTSSSPERQFYAIGHFPTFMPIPFDAETNKAPDGEQPESQPTVEQPDAPDPSSGQYTHSPYSSLLAPCAVDQCTSPPTYGTVADCMQPALHDPYFFPHRPYPRMPMFPQLPFPPECAMYTPQFPLPYHMGPEMYPMPYYQPVR